MERRALLRLLAAASVGAAFDPERLLWVPKPIITVPAMPTVFEYGGSFHTSWAEMTEVFKRIYSPERLESLMDHSFLTEAVIRKLNRA